MTGGDFPSRFYLHMKKTIQYALMLIITGLFAVIIYYGAVYKDKRTKTPETGDYRKPPKLVENGPYGVNVETTEQVGDCMFQIKAARIYVKKTKTLGFDNALFKQMVAKDVTVTVYKKKQIILKIHKETLSTLPNLNRIKIKNPEILFPDSLSQPDRVVIDKKKKHIVFGYGKQNQIWDLNRESYKEPPQPERK